MVDDDREVGVSVGWDGQQGSLNVKSRFFSAWDRYFGAKADRAGLATAEEIEVKRALTKSHVALIEAATATIAAHIMSDPDQAQRALAIYGRMSSQFENTTATLALVAEELKLSTAVPSETEANDPDTLDEDLLNRWEHYAGGATSEQLRERWARVLASEIRRPGTFSPKILRIVDELEAQVAILFERFCKTRIGSWAPAISHDLTSVELEVLSDAGLIRDEEIPRSIDFATTTRGDGSRWWMLRNDSFGVVVREASDLQGIGTSQLSFDDVRTMDGVLKINVNVLTTSGQALASIVPNNEEEAFRALNKSLLRYAGDDDVRLVKKNPQLGFVDDRES